MVAYAGLLLSGQVVATRPPFVGPQRISVTWPSIGTVFSSIYPVPTVARIRNECTPCNFFLLLPAVVAVAIASSGLPNPIAPEIRHIRVKGYPGSRPFTVPSFKIPSPLVIEPVTRPGDRGPHGTPRCSGYRLLDCPPCKFGDPPAS